MNRYYIPVRGSVSLTSTEPYELKVTRDMYIDYLGKIGDNLMQFHDEDYSNDPTQDWGHNAEIYFPYNILLRLDRKVKLLRIEFWDALGSNVIRFFTYPSGDLLNKQLVFQDMQANWDNPNSASTPTVGLVDEAYQETQFIRIETDLPTGIRWPYEIKFIVQNITGDPTFKVPSRSTPTFQRKTFDELISVCTFPDQPLSILAPFKNCMFREYGDAVWYIQGINENLEMAFEPGFAPFNVDTVFAERKAAGYRNSWCIKKVWPDLPSSIRRNPAGDFKVNYYITGSSGARATFLVDKDTKEAFIYDYTKPFSKINPAADGTYVRFDDEDDIVISGGIVTNDPFVGWFYDENAPIDDFGLDPYSKASYTQIAEVFRQITIRYGRNANVPDSEIKTAPGQIKKKGLDLVDQVEVGNELNQYWNHLQSYMHPWAFFALMEAVYEAVKAIDPTMLVATGGTAGIEPEYYKMMCLISDQKRGKGNYPWDNHCVHYYCNDLGGAQGDSTTGLKPENFIETAMWNMVDVIRRYSPNVYLELNEYGWDTYPTPQMAATIGELTKEHVQAAWLLRSNFLMAMIASDPTIISLAMYMLQDVYVGSGIKYTSSGLTTPPGARVPKLSWYAYYTSIDKLTGFVFDGEHPNFEGLLFNPKTDYKNASLHPDHLDKPLWVLRFRNDSDPTVFSYVVWLSSDIDESIDVTLSLPGYQTVNQTDYKKGYNLGVSRQLDYDGSVTITASNEPTILRAYTTAAVLPEAPTDFNLLELGETEVSFTFENEGENTEEYELEISTNGTDYSLNQTVNWKDREISVTGLTNFTDYWFRLKSVNSVGSSDYAEIQIKTIKSGLVLEDTFRFDFSMPEGVSPAGWIKVTGDMIGGFNTVFDTDKNLFVQGFIGAANTGHDTGNEAGVVPDDVVQDNFYSFTSHPNSHILVSGLDPAKFCKVYVFGSKGFDSTDRQVRYVIGSNEVTMNVANNLRNFAVFYPFNPASGQFDLLVQIPEGFSVSYINGLIIEIYS